MPIKLVTLPKQEDKICDECNDIHTLRTEPHPIFADLSKLHFGDYIENKD